MLKVVNVLTACNISATVLVLAVLFVALKQNFVPFEQYCCFECTFVELFAQRGWVSFCLVAVSDILGAQKLFT